MSDIEVHVICCTQQPVAAPDKLASNIWFHSLVVTKFGWMRTLYQGCIRATRKKLHQLQPDIVHAQGTERDCAMSGILSGFPNVLTIHGNHRLIAKVIRAKPFTFNWLAVRLESFVLPRTGGVVCITSYTENAVRDLASRTWIVPNAVDKKFFDVVSDLTDPPIILCVGNISVRKNQQQLIRALEPLAATRQFVVRFLGAASDKDPYAAAFMNLVKERQWCHYAGFASRDALAAELSRARLLVLPSLEDNCPMAVLEAAAAGVPVVASSVGGIPELIEHGKTGYLCDPNDPRDIRARVATVLEQPESSAAMARTAKDLAYKRFHPKEIASRHIEIYREVLRKSA